MSSLAQAPALALGVDAGGSGTRWALADAAGLIRAEGEAAPITGLQLLDAQAAPALDATLRDLAAVLPARPGAAWAGVTGLDATLAEPFARRLAAALGLERAAVHAASDIELLCRAAGNEPVLLYAGTGSIAAWLSPQGVLERAGGRGSAIDDAGSGHWIASEALRLVWRAEDEAPGAWRGSAMACALFDAIGGSDWRATREWVYGERGRARGAFARLALAVARSAEHDSVARCLLERAGEELARLVHALWGRTGKRPVMLAGRVFDLDPQIERSLRAALPAGTAVHRLVTPPHHAAAGLAAAIMSMPSSAAASAASGASGASGAAGASGASAAPAAPAAHAR